MKLDVGGPSLNPAFKRFQCLPPLSAGADRRGGGLTPVGAQRQGERLTDSIHPQFDAEAVLVPGVKVEVSPGPPSCPL